MTYKIWVSTGKNQDALLSERETAKEGEGKETEGKERGVEREQESALVCTARSAVLPHRLQ